MKVTDSPLRPLPSSAAALPAAALDGGCEPFDC
jgi:hypothetical protein